LNIIFYYSTEDNLHVESCPYLW